MAKFELKEDIEAPVERVWAVITDPRTWGMWFPGIDEASFAGALQHGEQFRWRDDNDSGIGSIVRAEQNRLLEVMIKEGDKTVSHRFTLHPKGGGFLGLGGSTGTTLEYDMDTGGGMLDQFIKGGNPIDQSKMKKALSQIENLSEGS